MMHLEGSCRCGAVTFSCDSHAPVPYQLCYCTICCKTAGGGGYAINLSAVAATHHRRHFGKDPAGIWLPECGYFPGLDAFLAVQNIRYFFVDTHGITDATPRPRYGVYAPIYTPTGPAAFGRDAESVLQSVGLEIASDGSLRPDASTASAAAASAVGFSITAA